MTISQAAGSELSSDKEEKKAAVRHKGSIISPFVDFIFVGGLYFLLLPLSHTPFFQNMDTHGIWWAAFYVSFIINFPHFIHSYQLLYPGLTKRLENPQTLRGTKIRLWLAAVIAPLCLLCLYIAALWIEDARLLGKAANVMYFLVGWHYIKQGFGVFNVLSIRKGLFFNDFEKQLLLVNSYIVWLATWMHFNKALYEHQEWGIYYQTLNMPDDFVYVGYVLMAISSVATSVMLFKKFRRDKDISLNGLTAYVLAAYAWIPLFQHGGYLLLSFVPALHSLQYLLFVWKIVLERSRDQVDGYVRASGIEMSLRREVFLRFSSFLLIGVIGGAVVFYLLPVTLDHFVSYNKEEFGENLYRFMCLIFINVHHYFIDFAIWRKDNAELRYLFK